MGLPDVFFVGAQAKFTGHNLCAGGGAGIDGLQFTVVSGEDPLLSGRGFFGSGQFVPRTTVDPNGLGAALYSQALEDALALASWRPMGCCRVCRDALYRGGGLWL